VNRFVKECRREWRRLGVADAVADEMAEELAADLAEAEEDGASAADVLGSGAFDPRSFAASWATARGVTQSSSGTARPHRNPRLLAAVTGLLSRPFAATWATARGVTQSSSGRARRRRSPLIRAAVTGLLLVALAAGAALVISGATQLDLSNHYGKRVDVGVAPPGTAPTQVTRAISVARGTSAITLQPLGWTLLVMSVLGILLRLAWSWWTDTGSWTRQLRRHHTSPGAAV
jgi:hypothetical protein